VGRPGSSPGTLPFPLRFKEKLPLGAGAIVAFGRGVDLWEVLLGLAHFFHEESCGKCFPCPLGRRSRWRWCGGGSGTPPF
jgi:NADH-quinone oxidoreductase subunit F